MYSLYGWMEYKSCEMNQSVCVYSMKNRFNGFTSPTVIRGRGRCAHTKRDLLSNAFGARWRRIYDHAIHNAQMRYRTLQRVKC